MSETLSDDPTLSEVCSNLHDAESLAIRSGRNVNFPHITVEQEKVFLDLLRDRLTSLRKSVQVGLLNRYIRVCSKASVSYPPLPITGIKACLYIIKVSNGVTGTPIQEKLAIVIENWRIILEQLVGPQIAGYRSIWTTKALCQISGRVEPLPTTPTTASSGKRKRSTETLNGAHDNNSSSSQLQSTQCLQASSSKTPHISPSLELSCDSASPSTLWPQKNTPQQDATPPNPTITQPTNNSTSVIPIDHGQNSNESSSSNFQIKAVVLDITKAISSELNPTTNQASLAVAPVIVTSENNITPKLPASSTTDLTALPKPLTESCPTTSLVSVHQNKSQSKLLVTSSSDKLISKPVHLINHQLQVHPTPSPAIDSTSQALDSQTSFSVSLSTSNLLSYWQHSFHALDLAVSELLEVIPPSHHLPLRMSTNYYPHAYSPGFQWVPQAVASYAPPPILECANTAPVLSPQSEMCMTAKSLITPNLSHSSQKTPSDVNLHRKLSNDSTTSGMNVLPSQLPAHSQQSSPPDMQQQCSLQPEESLTPRKSIQLLEKLPDPQFTHQTAQSSHQPPNVSINPMQPTPTHSRQLTPTQFNQQPNMSPLNHPGPSHQPQKSVPTQVLLAPTLPSNHPHPNLQPQKSVSTSQQPEEKDSTPTSQQSVPHPAKPGFQATEAQKVKFVDTYCRLDVAGKARLEATLRQNNIWETLSPLLSKSINDTTRTNDHQATSSSIQSDSSMALIPLQLTCPQPSLSSPAASTTPSQPLLAIAAPNVSNTFPVKSAVCPQVSLNSTTSQTGALLNVTPINTSSVPESSLDPILSEMIVAMLAPGPQSNTVVMRAFVELGIHNNDAITTHLKVLAVSLPDVKGTLWKLRTPVEAPSLIPHQDVSSIPTLDPPTSLKITGENIRHEVEQAPLSVVAPIKPPAIVLSTNHQDRLVTPIPTERPQHEVESSPLTPHSEIDLSRAEEESRIPDRLNDSKQDKSTLSATVAENKKAEARTEDEEQIEIIDLTEHHDRKSVTPSGFETQASPRVPTKMTRSQVLATPKQSSSNVNPTDPSSQLSFDVFQDDLPGFPDVDPSFQVQGTPARILARYTADQQMPPIRTFVPLIKKTPTR